MHIDAGTSVHPLPAGCPGEIMKRGA